jgi:hypothetical protein
MSIDSLATALIKGEGMDVSYRCSVNSEIG